MSFTSKRLLTKSKRSALTEGDPYFNDTVLLLHGDGSNGQTNKTFLDSSSNNFTITLSGSVTQGSVSPYALNGVAYSPTLHGGSGYFPGVNSNYLSVSSNAGFNFSSGAFTVECWVMTSNSSAQQQIVGNYNSTTTGWTLQTYSNNFTCNFSGDVADITGTTTIVDNVWYHIAVSGSVGSYKLFVNGVQEGATYTGATSLTGGKLGIGAYADRPSWIGLIPFKGYISNLRITNGAALYTSNFIPPTSPVTLTSNGGATPSTAPTSGQVSLLCDFTNGGIIDNTKKNVLTTVGGSQITTTIQKFGTGSIAVTNNSYISSYTSDAAAATTFGTSNFTIEMWICFFFFSPAGTYGICDASGQAGGSTGQFTLAIQNGTLCFKQNPLGVNPVAIVSRSWSPNMNNPTWYHLAVSRSGTSLKMFIDGVEQASATNSTNFVGSGINIGAVTNPYYLQGFIDDFRITKGVARYTSNFTPPTRALPDK